MFQGNGGPGKMEKLEGKTVVRNEGWTIGILRVLKEKSRDWNVNEDR